MRLDIKAKVFGGAINLGEAVKAAGTSSKFILKVDEKGRITIPLSVREVLNIEPGMLVELLVNPSDKTIVLKPLTTGVIANYRIRLRNRNEVVDIITTILEEGSELKYLELGESECSIGVLAMDNVMVEKLAEKLQMKGVNVIEYTTK
ncbi:MAG: hypothetical protein QXT76_06945 [Sulfolobales archaeon]